VSIKAKTGRSTKPARAAKASNYHHGSLRLALIHAARDILESQGYDALTLRATARRVGVSQAAPYNHFADKAALLAAVAALGFKEFAAAMRQEMVAAENPRARLNAAGIAYVAFATSNPGLFKLMFGSSAHHASRDPDLDAARNSAYEVLSGVVHSVEVSGPRDAAQEELESLRSSRAPLRPAFMVRVRHENSLPRYWLRHKWKRKAALLLRRESEANKVTAARLRPLTRSELWGSW